MVYYFSVTFDYVVQGGRKREEKNGLGLTQQEQEPRELVPLQDQPLLGKTQVLAHGDTCKECLRSTQALSHRLGIITRFSRHFPGFSSEKEL